jgi:uncharacterized protein involved in response to NO
MAGHSLQQQQGVHRKPVPRLQPYNGPALLSYGFRPFFLLAALYSGLAILVWLPMFYGELSAATTLAPRDWHVHEMLFGYVAAVVTGFLLTSIPNWTGRLPLQGMPLLVLVIVWLVGRVAVSTSAWIGWASAAAIDSAFLLLVTAAAAREVAAGRNWRNLRVVAVVAVLAFANIGFHLEARFFGAADYSIRAGLGAIVLLVTLVGGRVIPSFTHSWLARASEGRLPASFSRFDAVTVAGSAAALLLWIAMPAALVTAIALLLAGIVQAARLVRWAGERTYREPLVFILHVAYAFVAIGFLLTGAGALGMVAVSAGIHAWAVGAVGTMTLAIMTRASLGHTGRPLIASASTRAIYVAVVIAALARIVAALQPDWSELLLHVAALAWAAAFLGFAFSYMPILCSPRQ